MIVEKLIICAAIMKVLDYNKRRIPFTITDSTNSNKEDIEIEITLTADNLTNEQLALIGNYIHIDDDKKYIKVKLISKFNEETLEYEDTLYYGNTEMDFEEIRINSQTQLDKVLAIVYINPVYNVETSKKDFFKFKESDNKEKGIFFSENIINEISNLNTSIQNTIDFEKANQIIKIGYNHLDKKRKIYYFNGIDNDEFKKFGYLINVEVAEMLYYDNVLLIEGDSEKYFYSLLMSKDNNFCNKIHEKRFGIYAVNGIAFKTIKELLRKLGITVYIKTDNDIFKVPKKQKYRYAGLERCIEYLDKESIEELKKILNVEKLEFRFTDKEALLQRKLQKN